MSVPEYRAMLKNVKKGYDNPQPSKYHNVKTTVDGILFDSKAEASRYCELKLLMQAGEIQGFGIQPSFVIGLGLRYKADFIVCDKTGRIWIEDVKSEVTAKISTFIIKAKLMREKYPWLELRLVI